MVATIGSGTLAAQTTNLIAPVLGTLTGTVEDDQGNMVPPQAAISATVEAQQEGSDIIAMVSGTASCTGGLGLHITFEATYDLQSNSFTGMYSDVPGGPLNTPITFVNNGGLSYSAIMQGDAPSPTGSRAYDLSYDFEVPQEAIFEAQTMPDEITFSGNLLSDVTVPVSISVPEINLDESFEVDLRFEGSWSAVAIPQLDGNAVLTGSASGTFSQQNTISITVTLPVVGSITVPVDIQGSFGGSLFLIDATNVAFQGSWAVSTGGEFNQDFGGDLEITVNTEDTSVFPYRATGSLPISTGIEGQPEVTVEFLAEGMFPLDLNI